MTYKFRQARLCELDTLVAIDDAASTLYSNFGMRLGLTRDHPFAVAERERWCRAIEQGRLFVTACRIRAYALRVVPMWCKAQKCTAVARTLVTRHLQARQAARDYIRALEKWTTQ